jgi:transposase InsO family protein
MVAAVIATHGLSQRRACGLIEITRRSFGHAPGQDRNRELRERLRALAEERRRWGCPMLYQIIRREGWQVNHKRVERLYREQGLSLRRRRRRKRLSHLRVVRQAPVAANQAWALDFVHDRLRDGRGFRALAVIDEWSRESLAIEIDVSLTGERVKRVLERLSSGRGLPATIQSEERSGVYRPGARSVGLRERGEAAVQRAGQANPERLHRELQPPAARGMPQPARLRLTRRRALQDREVESRIQPGTAALESRPSDTGGVRSKESGELCHRAHRLASRPRAGRRGAMRSGLGSKTRSFFDRPQIMKGAPEKLDHEK